MLFPLLFRKDYSGKKRFKTNPKIAQNSITFLCQQSAFHERTQQGAENCAKRKNESLECNVICYDITIMEEER